MRRTLIALCAALAPSIGYAHLFTGDGGPGAGFMHPLTGPDHFVAMFSVGLLSAQLGGRALWSVPSAFVALMLAGGGAAWAGMPLVGIDPGIALSVLALGAAVVAADRIPVAAALVAAGVFGFLHGFAHGEEMPKASSPALYAAGFVVTTAGLHAMGALSGLLAECRAGGARNLRWGGALISCCGIIFVARAFVPAFARWLA